MWKVGTLVTAIRDTSFSIKAQTLEVVSSDERWTLCKIKGKEDKNDKHPFFTNELEKLSKNPLTRMKRMFKRAFEIN